MFWLPATTTSTKPLYDLNIEIGLHRMFRTANGENLLPLLQGLAKKVQEFQTLEEEAIQDESMLEVPTSPTKDCTRITDMFEGEYIFRHFDSTTFCCAQCTILFLEPLDENTEPKTDIEPSTYGERD